MAERDFSNFRLMSVANDRENVYELAGGVIPEIAERLDVEIGIEPNSEDLGKLAGKIGKNKVLRDNDEVTAIDRETAADLVDQAGTQKLLFRSLWTPDHKAIDLDAAVITGGVANWQDRTARTVENSVDPQTPVIIAAGKRVMDSPTEKTNPNVKSFLDKYGYYPTEADYVDEVVAPLVAETHPNVVWDRYIYEDASNGDEIAERVFAANPELLDQRTGFVRVANAGIQLAVQMRAAGMNLKERYDDTPDEPQVFVITDSFPLARTAKQEQQPTRYQKAIPALRQVAITAKMLHETVEHDEFLDHHPDH